MRRPKEPVQPVRLQFCVILWSQGSVAVAWRVPRLRGADVVPLRDTAPMLWLPTGAAMCLHGGVSADGCRPRLGTAAFTGVALRLQGGVVALPDASRRLPDVAKAFHGAAPRLRGGVAVPPLLASLRACGVA